MDEKRRVILNIILVEKSILHSEPDSPTRQAMSQPHTAAHGAGIG
jgi:hypothetical protein